jgi:hypothetical protein
MAIVGWNVGKIPQPDTNPTMRINDLNGKCPEMPGSKREQTPSGRRAMDFQLAIASSIVGRAARPGPTSEWTTIRPAQPQAMSKERNGSAFEKQRRLSAPTSGTDRGRSLSGAACVLLTNSGTEFQDWGSLDLYALVLRSETYPLWNTFARFVAGEIGHFVGGYGICVLMVPLTES